MLNIFQSLSKLRIVLFWEILENNNPFLLDIAYQPGKRYSKEEEDLILSTWENLYDEFFEIRQDSKGMALLRESEEEMFMLYKTNLLIEVKNNLIDMFAYIEVMDVKIFESIKLSMFQTINKIERKLKFDIFMDLPQAVKMLDRAINALQNAYSLKKKRHEQEIKRQKNNMYSIVAAVENILDRSIPNIDTMSAMQWLAIEKTAIEVGKSKKDKNHGKK